MQVDQQTQACAVVVDLQQLGVMEIEARQGQRVERLEQALLEREGQADARGAGLVVQILQALQFGWGEDFAL